MQELAQFGSLPAGVELIVMRQEKVSATKVAATAAKVSTAVAAPHISPPDVPPFHAASGPSAITYISSPAPPPAAAIAVGAAPPIVPPTVAPVPSSLPHTVASAPSSSSHEYSPPTLAPKPVSPPSSSVLFPSALSFLKSAVSDAAAAAIAYYDDIEFAAQLCGDAASQHGTTYALSVPLQEACISLQRILASKPPSMPSKVIVTFALADAESLLQADPGLKSAWQRIKDSNEQEAQRLRDDVSQAEQDCRIIMSKLQADEGDARSSAANDTRLLEQQLGVDAAQLNQMKDEESRALAAQDIKSADAANARTKAYVAECSQRAQAATSKRKLDLEQQLLQLRTAAKDATAQGEQRVAAQRSALEAAAAVASHRLQDFDSSSASLAALIARARELLGRQPACPQHEALLRFDLPLQCITTHMMFSKKWFLRCFCLSGPPPLPLRRQDRTPRHAGRHTGIYAVEACA